jgi:hypothetical protein
MTTDYDNVETRIVRTVTIPSHVLDVLDALLTGIDVLDGLSVRSARDDQLRDDMTTLYDETMGAWLPSDYAEILHIEAGQLIGQRVGPVTMALANLNDDGWSEVDALDQRPADCLTLDDVIREARGLTVPGPVGVNPEYERALVELTCRLSGDYRDDPDGRRASIERKVLGR